MHQENISKLEKDQIELSVVIPFYNEEKIVFSTFGSVQDYLDKKDISYEIIPVNDGSDDHTGDKIKHYRAEKDKIKPISYEVNHGKGYAVKRGMKASKGNFVLFMDADLSTPLEEIDRVLKIKERYDIIIGSRDLPESKIILPQPLYRRILGKSASHLTRFFLGLRFKDTRCGFKLFKKDVLWLFDIQKIKGFGFDFEILFLANKFNLKVKEIPITWYNGLSSSVNIMSAAFMALQLISVLLNDLRGKYGDHLTNEKL